MKHEVTYVPVITYTVKSYGNEYHTKEEAMKELLEEMENHKAPNYTFNIIKYEYENCTAEEWNEK